MKWLLIIAIVFICLCSPIVLFMYIWYMPEYVIIMFFAWIISSIAIIAFVDDDGTKGKVNFFILLSLAIIFTIIFCGSIDTNHYLFDEDNGLWLFAPTLSLPAIYLIGSFFAGRISNFKRSLARKRTDKLKKQIEEAESQIQHLNNCISGRTTMLHFLSLIHACGGEISDLESHQEIVNVSRLQSEVAAQKQHLIELQQLIIKR